ncbi:glycosyltransferase [Bacteroides sp. 51]|uniref:glycosyltransferase n=1 Tax=Bacteroides sp. 51 TaxID=2302938 RepID=UPI0013D41F4D|nr:glycosyltransferase [Bacteroides sp. 51]NDV81493.1 hypothetical protein [Bacteroides sp. 51]
MISVIICSKYPDISRALRKNIQETIGSAHEIIVIDNSKNKYSIFEAYNDGVSKAAFEYCCFVHEDVLFHTTNWGANLISHFEVPNVGLIGLAGSYYLLNIPSLWFKAKPFVKNLIQSNLEGEMVKVYNTVEGVSQEVLCVDGFCFFIKKSLFDKIAFDTQTFDGFHFYDLDICLQVKSNGYKVLVVSDILVEHFSGGSLNRAWLESALCFYDKWNKIYPLQVNSNIRRRFLGDTIAFRELLLVASKNRMDSKTMSKIRSIGWAHIGVYILVGYMLYYIKRLTNTDKRYRGSLDVFF